MLSLQCRTWLLIGLRVSWRKLVTLIDLFVSTLRMGHTTSPYRSNCIRWSLKGIREWFAGLIGFALLLSPMNNPTLGRLSTPGPCLPASSSGQCHRRCRVHPPVSGRELQWKPVHPGFITSLHICRVLKWFCRLATGARLNAAYTCKHDVYYPSNTIDNAAICNPSFNLAEKKYGEKLLYFVWSPPWHFYMFLLANLLAFYLTYLLASYLAFYLA